MTAFLLRSRRFGIAVGVAVCGVVLSASAAPAQVAPAKPLIERRAPAASSLDDILNRMATYDGGLGSEAVWQLREFVRARRDTPAGRLECEGRLIRYLGSAATPSAKLAASRQLRLVAGESGVPALQALLADERTFDLALYALQPIPGAVADAALLQALKTSTGASTIALMAALGERKTVAAVPVIAPWLQQPALATQTAMALGRMGGNAANTALLAALPNATATSKPVIASSLLAGAEAVRATGDAASALRLYDALATDASLPPTIRKAVAAGRIATAGDKAKSVLVEYMTAKDVLLHEAAIAQIPTVFGPAEIGVLGLVVPTLGERATVQLLGVLASYPAAGARPIVMPALSSEAAPVRLAAMAALANIGGPESVRPLADAGARLRGSEQTAARTALAGLKGRGIDEEIVAQLAAKPANPVAGELLLAIGERRVFAGMAAVSAILASSDATLRVPALKALRGIGTPSDMPAVLDLLVAAPADASRTDLENTVVALAQKIDSVENRSRFVRSHLSAAKKAEAKVRLIGLLPTIGDPSALPILRALTDDVESTVFDAAVRAIAAWPTSAAREDMLRLARDSRIETHRLLAIVGLVRVIGLDKFRDPVEAVADLRHVAGCAWRPEEQKLILGALAQFPSREALDLATGFLREPAVEAEARAAIGKITPRMPKEAIRK